MMDEAPSTIAHDDPLVVISGLTGRADPPGSLQGPTPIEGAASLCLAPIHRARAPAPAVRSDLRATPL